MRCDEVPRGPKTDTGQDKLGNVSLFAARVMHCAAILLDCVFAFVCGLLHWVHLYDRQFWRG